MLLLQKVRIRRKTGLQTSVVTLNPHPNPTVNPHPHPLMKVGRIVGTVSLTFPLFQTSALVQVKRRHGAGQEQPSSSGLDPSMAQMTVKQKLKVC